MNRAPHDGIMNISLKFSDFRPPFTSHVTDIEQQELEKLNGARVKTNHERMAKDFQRSNLTLQQSQRNAGRVQPTYAYACETKLNSIFELEFIAVET